MAGMKGDGQFQRKRSEEEYDIAVKRVISLGHGGMAQVSEETGIPYETLRRKVEAHRLHRGLPRELASLEQLPKDGARARMAAKVERAIWVEVCRAEELQKAGKPLNAKALAEYGNALKAWDGVAKPQTEKPKSALSGLQKAS
jgi:hypothetical protein